MTESEDLRAQEAMRLMSSYVERTGLEPPGPHKRYLWTDAFAVCNLLGLGRTEGRLYCADLALQLIDAVHRVLGRHRPDDRREGWISGLGDQDAASHPTRGGLRIGKELPERRADEPFDERLEWERDGQYFHYLTKWMHALDQASRHKADPRFNRWARELAETAYASFTYDAGGADRRIVWKLSIDRSRPLVAAMGQHDPLEGLIVCMQLRSTAAELGEPGGPRLDRELSGFASIVEGRDWATVDPLGLGGLLMDAGRLAQLDVPSSTKDDLLASMLTDVLAGLREYLRMGDLSRPASQRLAFRELGLSIGMRTLEIARRRIGALPESGEAAVERDQLRIQSACDGQVAALLEEAKSYEHYGARIEEFWLEPRHRETSSWLAHRDINEVMLATSLAPEGFSLLAPVGGRS